MDLARLRFGDWVMGIGGLAALLVMFMDWYETPNLVLRGSIDASGGKVSSNAWESFAVTDLILAAAAVMAIIAFILVATQPTAAVPLALSSLTTLVAILAFVAVTLRLIWPPDFGLGELVDPARLTGAWLGFVATTVLTAGCLASLRDERSPQPDHPVEPRLVEP